MVVQGAFTNTRDETREAKKKSGQEEVDESIRINFNIGLKDSREKAHKAAHFTTLYRLVDTGGVGSAKQEEGEENCCVNTLRRKAI